MNNQYLLIMAGGVGSRFWPISRSGKPKQFLDIMGMGRTLLQLTADRFQGVVPEENIYVVTVAEYCDLVMEQLPFLKRSQVICEPMRNNTAPCIGYATFRIAQLNPDAVVSILPSDHIIMDTGSFTASMNKAMQFCAEQEVIVSLGITPSRPDTGYGYIKADKQHISQGFHKVECFVEKPVLSKAISFLESGDYLWNAGIFVANVKTLLKQFAIQAPGIYAVFEKGLLYYNTNKEEEFVNKYYSECPNISFDYAIAEKAPCMYTLPVNFGWSDVGTWGALYEIGEKNLNGNYIRDGRIYEMDTRNCIIEMQHGKTLVVKGLENFIIVDTADVLLIFPKENEQEIKKVTEQFKKSGELTLI